MKKQLLLPVVFFLLAAGSLTAQAIYPVTVAPQVTPPTPLYLSSFADAGYSSYNPLRVQLLLNDLGILNRQVRLKIYLEGNGYAAQSRDFVAGASPLELNSGVPLQLTHADLATYFRFENLMGISPAQYAQPLPEGVYQFCFEVYDVLTGARLSAKSCANTVIFRNQPPLLVAPARGVVVQEQNPPFIIFQWTPRHLNVSNVEYELSLVEVWDAGVDPQGAFLASPPLFTAVSRTTSYMYGPADPMLLTGKTYAWRVRARALVGADEVGLFTNQGYSEVFHFRYVAPCAAPQQVAVQQVSASMATVGWWSDGQHLDFTVQYREKGTTGWYEGVTPREFFTLNGLKPETVYEFQVVGNCEGGAATSSPVYGFTTLSREEAGYQGCNIDIVATPVANQQPLALLFVNDVIRAADFPVTVTQVEKNTPPFKGKGYTLIPWLQDTKIAVEFTNITVNTDNQLISGEIKTTYDPAWGNVVALESVVQDIKAILNSLLNLLQNFTGTEEQVTQYTSYTDLIHEEVEVALNDPNVADEIKEELQQLQQDLAQQSEQLLADVSQHGPNPNGYSYNTSHSITTLQQIQEVLDALNESPFDAASQTDFQQQADPEDLVVYVSPAGVPVALPQAARPRFLKANTLQVPAGVLSGFTLGNAIYEGYYHEAVFRGYKTKKGEKPYEFSPLPDKNYIRAVIALNNPGSPCRDFFLVGAYEPTMINPTGEGTLLTGARVSFSEEFPLLELFADYTTCLPDVSRVAFDQYIWGYYNYYGRGGFLRLVQNEEGGLTYLYSVASGENGAVQNFQYNPATGKWYYFSEPPHDCLSCELAALFSSLNLSDIGHVVLDMAGMAPVLGEAFDFANGLWYVIEGNGTDAALSFAATIPMVYSTGVRYVGKIVKVADGTYQTVKFIGKNAENFIDELKRLNLDAESLRVLNDDLNTPAFATALTENPGLLESWKKMLDLNADEVIRKNPDYLKNIDDYAKRSGKGADEVADLAKNNENGIEQFLDELENTPSSGHWDKNPFQRGKDIEDDLGQNLPETFKTVDKYDDVTGEVTSIKSIDLDAKTYQTDSKLRSRLNKYLDELNVFQGYSIEGVNIGNVFNGRPINSKSLEIAIPRAATGSQLNIINDIVSSGLSRGITVKVVVIQ